MRNEVTIAGGITLTRAQVEQAIKDLNGPGFTPGQTVMWNHRIYKVMSDEMAAKHGLGPVFHGAVRITDGRTTFVPLETAVKLAEVQ